MNALAVVVEKVKAGAVSLAREAPKMLAFVAKLGDARQLKECKAQAAAVAEYLAQKKDVSVGEYNAAIKIRARVKHRLGEVLAETVKPRSHNASGNGMLPEEISKMESSRAQELARIDWEEIESQIDKKTEKNERASETRIVKELRQELQREDNNKLVEQAILLQDVPGTYSTIVADPPWDWEDEGDVSQFGRGRHEYRAMPFDKLMAQPVASKAEPNCHLYLWITNRSLPKGFDLLENWGFRYVTCITWCKPSFGMGNYFRGSTEHILFGVKGSLALLRADVGTWFSAQRPGRHSAKPEDFYQMVESCSPGPWLEMFARVERPGWFCWGAEV